MEAMDRIKKAKVAIMRHPKFCAFSGVLAYGDHVINDKIPTARTNGRDVEYSTKFVASLTDPQLRLLVLHEGVHIAYRHTRVWRDLWKENAQLANQAADHFVNLALVETDAGEGFISMPTIGVQPDKKYSGWNVRQIYEDLKQQQQQGGGGGKGKGKGNGQGQGQGQGQGEGEPGLDEHDWEAGEGMSQEEEQAEARVIDQALRQGELLARKLSQGKGNGRSSALLDDLLESKIDWREQLRDFVRETCAGRDESTWSRPNRRYIGMDTYMPAMQGITIGELVIVFDTSGSCFYGPIMQSFASELAGVIEQVKPSKVRVLYTDWTVAGEQVFEDGQFAVQNMDVKGGGGTDMTVAFQYVADHNIRPEACIVFTDGYTPFGTATPYPTLWCITERSIRSPWGTTLHIDE
jgi:predicted metal-dependent peptidase